MRLGLRRVGRTLLSDAFAVDFDPYLAMVIKPKSEVSDRPAVSEVEAIVRPTFLLRHTAMRPCSESFSAM